MPSPKLLSYNLKQISQLLHSGKITPSELCELCLSRITKVNNLNAYITVTAEKLRKQAAASDERFKKGKTLGPLDGIPFAVKDNFNTKNDITSCGSKILKNYVSPYDSTVVTKLQDAGMLLTGKVNLDEFAMGCYGLNSCFGPVKNIWQSNHTYKLESEASNDVIHEGNNDDDNFLIAGGSSCGSAVSVASGTCFLSFGSDTGGSVRVPAAFCGVVGFKPTYGSLSRNGLIPLVNSLDVPGLFTRSVEDASIVFEYLCGIDDKDSTTVDYQYVHEDKTKNDINKLVVGVPQEFLLDHMDEDIRLAWESVIESLDNSSIKVVPVSIPHMKYSLACYKVLNCCEVASNMARYDGIRFGLRSDNDKSTKILLASSRHAGFNDEVRGRILTGNFFLLRKNYDKYFNQALKVRRLIKDDFQKVFQGQKVDVLIAPTVEEKSISYKKLMGENSHNQHFADYFTQPANLAGIPALSMPVGVSECKLPISLQLMADNFQEKKLFKLAKFIEKKVKFPRLTIL